MRGKVSDQDLTDYALNELTAEERLYVESMLAVSEECRNDVYEMIDVGQMLEEGFETEEEMAPASLTSEQRQQLVHFSRPLPLWQKAAAVAACAACAAMAITHADFWRVESPRNRVADASIHMSKMVTGAVVPSNARLANSISNVLALAEDTTSSWLPAASEVWTQAPMVCTPPSWLDSSQVTALGDMGQ